MKNFNSNLYSRQVETYGIDTMKKILDLKIIVIGLRGLGIEISKNIILSGIKKITLFDDNLCSINDLSSNFFITEEDVNINRRDKACLNKLSELNPYVEISLIEKKTEIKNQILENDILIITELIDREILYEYNNICRENNKGFIYSCAFGLCGFIFNDFGDEHIIYNKTGKDELKFYIKNIIKKDGKYIVTIKENEDENLYQTSSDYFSFKNIKGMEKLNNENSVKIKIINSTSFSIENTNDYGEYISGGIIFEQFIPEKLKFSPLKESILNPFLKESKNKSLNIKEKKKELLHITILSLHYYYSFHKSLPSLNNNNDIKEIINLIKIIIELLPEKEIIKKIKEIDENYVLKVIKFSQNQISPISTFLGGIVTQEIIKYTGKYFPFYQWFHFDFFELLDNINENVERKLLNSRYDDQISIFGNEIISKLNNLNIFLIGAGALGCEFLKIFSLMGLSKNNNKKITVTDNDNIELSNLNRQFLFRNKDINKSKSEIACKKSKEINKEINFIYYNYKLDNQTENIFNDDFWEEQNLIISAVDNPNSRLYIDNKITFYNIPFFECGTLGTSASSNIFLPKLTNCYKDIYIDYKKEIPLCTLKSFPNNIEHCVEWAKLFFEELFTLNIQNLNTLINKCNQFFNIIDNNINKNDVFNQLIDIEKLIEMYISKKKDLVIKYCVWKFNLFFKKNIENLLKDYPENCEDKDGNLFWNESRRMPHPITYNSNDEISFLFIKSMFNIYNRILNINSNEITDENIKKISDKYIKELIDNDEEDSKIENIENSINILKQEININLSKLITKDELFPESFEKENQNNSHINLIYSMSILRARNYDIEEKTKEKIKSIITNIIPAIISSTATIAGFISLQIYNIVQSNNKNSYRSLSFELATNWYVISLTDNVNYSKDIEATSTSLAIKNIPYKFTVWDYIPINASLKVKEFIQFIENKYNFNVNYINSDNLCLVDVLLMEDNDEDYEKKIEDLYFEKKNIKYKVKYIKFNVSGTQNNCYIKMPPIKYIL